MTWLASEFVSFECRGEDFAEVGVGNLFISRATGEAYFFPLNLDEYAHVRCMIMTIPPAWRLAEFLLQRL